ncbi:hypothetical protein LP419_28965 [Massilia sp. H-1]|nr:hypothetical protein LP419_28965 [Massilia sp. H-1]
MRQDEASLAEVSARLKQLCYRIEIKTGDLAEQQELLMRLFKLLLNNVSELLDEDSWLRGQIDVVQELISGPIDPRAGRRHAQPGRKSSTSRASSSTACRT